MSETIQVDHKGGDLFEISIRGHIVHVDQPVADGGSDAAPTPTELFVAGLASCVAYYARRYLVRHNLPTERLTVSTTFEMAKRPNRVGQILVSITVPEGVPAEQLPALLAVASACTVHNSLAARPEVTIELAA